MPHPDEFAEWRQHPVTEWVLDIMERWARRQKQEWADMAWQAGEVDPQALLEARVRADCYLAIPETAFEDWTALEERLSDTED